MGERFPFLSFSFGWGKKKDNKDSARWERKEKRYLINELQHLRGGALAAGGGGPAVTPGSCSGLRAWDADMSVSPHDVPCLLGQVGSQPKPRH